MTYAIKKFSEAVYWYCEKSMVTSFLLFLGFVGFLASKEEQLSK